MKFTFSLRVTLFCSTLALLMSYASYWQYTRYIAKLAYIEELDQRLKMPVEALSALTLEHIELERLYHRRVKISGTWDYQHEVILRNRKVNEDAGVFVITPLKINGLNEKRVLVSRGFIPLSVSSREARKEFQNGPTEEFTALVKESMHHKLFSPQDPKAGIDKDWVDAWLRIEVEAIGKQLPYPILPFYLEIMPDNSTEVGSNKMIQEKSERDQLLFLPGAGARLSSLKTDLKNEGFPLPVFDSIVPAGRHFSYIFEWAVMAFGVLFTGVVLQFRQNVVFRSNLPGPK